MDGANYDGAVEAFFRVLWPGVELIFSVTHPCFMTGGFGWIGDEQGSIKLTVSNYFD